MIEIEIDGKQLEVADGSTIIEAADAAGIYIPRFCYHKKLSVAANCRMCLVEVEKAPKPMPACATPVTHGMKVQTKSEKALQAQRDVMEFLLVNHPLDCPICDQGGECELQDVSMGYGNCSSHYDERKRAVPSPDLGPLIETEMTRCIQCTRCVRFGEEIAGQRELGLVNRGEKEAISTYIQTTVSSEVSGNVIDICPVGALTNKPFRYQARAWEMVEHPTLSPHDCLGTNMFVHTRSEIENAERRVMRAVPRDNEAINETWMSDRDRFAVDALYHADRVYKPMVKRKGKWLETSWEAILPEVADKLLQITQADPNKLAVAMGKSCSTEEYYLLQKIIRMLGSNNIDCRLRQQDFSQQATAPEFPSFGMKIAEIETADQVLLVGGHIRHEQPLLALRLVKACNEESMQVSAINACAYDFNFPLSQQLLLPGFALVSGLAQVAIAAAKEAGKKLSPAAEKIAADLDVSESAVAMAKQLLGAEKGVILLGAEAIQHADAAQFHNWASELARLTGAVVAQTTNGANEAGAWLAGAIPHRSAAMGEVSAVGLDAQRQFSEALPAYVLFNVDPTTDSINPAVASKALDNAQCVISINTFMSDALKDKVDYILPLAPFTESDGTFVNIEGMMQRFKPTSIPFAESKPGWKILRVLGNFLQLDGFGYETNEEVTDELTALMANMPKAPEQTAHFKAVPKAPRRYYRLAHWPMYSNDQFVRRSDALQRAERMVNPSIAQVAVNQAVAERLNLKAGDRVQVTQDEQSQQFTLAINPALADHTVLLPLGITETHGFGAGGSAIELARVEG